ncbi:MAG TPA: enoyl-CoA hydratase-related protein [Thermoplasmata archaeon]|nr:enoyl-CoA hydratase-related protein [Thermoplasmata archaeon]
MVSAGQLVGRKSEEDGVEILVLKNPPVNAISTTLMRDLEGQVKALAEDPKVRAVIITGDGQYFSAGADLKEMATLDLSTAPEIVRRGHALFKSIAELKPPVVAAINGLAVGGGLELALSCDIRVAGESAKLGAPEVVYGLMPAYGGTQRLPRLIGLAKAKELIFTGAMISAAEALKIGLVNRTVPSGQELRAARDLAHTIAQKAPKAVQAAKRAMREGIERPLTEGIAFESQQFEHEVLPSEDLGEGIAAFVERRPPKFKGA